jgi:hypothetical protein
MTRLLLSLVFVFSIHAQDTRRVTEPVFPESCAVLQAHLADVDEAKPDTRRIQQALSTTFSSTPPIPCTGPLRMPI